MDRPTISVVEIVICVASVLQGEGAQILSSVHRPKEVGGVSVPQEWAERHPETPAQFRVLHRVLIAIAVVFFVWLIVEGAVLVPWLFIRYGFH
jgi:hypothetical protein